MSPGVIALLAATIAALGGVIAKRYETIASTKTTVQSAVSKTLDEVWNQRVLFRDEQIADLRAELVEQAVVQAKQDAARTLQIADLTAEVQRLSALVVKLGGRPHE